MGERKKKEFLEDKKRLWGDKGGYVDHRGGWYGPHLLEERKNTGDLRKKNVSRELPQRNQLKPVRFCFSEEQ